MPAYVWVEIMPGVYTGVPVPVTPAEPAEPAEPTPEPNLAAAP